MEFTPINGDAGLIARVKGKAISTMTFDIQNGQIQQIWMMRNPDKLRHLEVIRFSKPGLHAANITVIPAASRHAATRIERKNLVRILITGATGNLGSAIIRELQDAGHTLRIMSRRPAPVNITSEWIRSDLVTQDGLEAAVQAVDVLVHCASAATQLTKIYPVDVLGTKALLNHARQAGVKHVIYPSIVGMDKIDFIYFRHKLAAEKIVTESGIPYSIVRIAQFHDFVDLILDSFLKVTRWLPFYPMQTRLQFQTIDVRDVALYLHPYILGQAVGRIPDLVGPQLLGSEDMIRLWLETRGINKPLVHIPLPFGPFKGFARGDNTLPEEGFGTITWADYVREKYTA